MQDERGKTGRAGRATAWLRRLLLAASAACALPSGAAEPLRDFDRGIADFQGGRYGAALAAFQAAARGGLQTPQLRYNLAVTYFKLGDYEHAREQFTSLTADADSAALAHYNLGLIALEQDRNAAAQAEFVQAMAAGADPRVAALARERLDELAQHGAPFVLPPARWFAFADLAGGYDDNVSFSSAGSPRPPSQRHSAATSVLLGGGTALGGDLREGLLLSGSLYRVDYFNVSAYSANEGRLGLAYRLQRGDWRAALGLQGGVSTLGGHGFENQYGLRADLGRDLGRHDTASLGYRLDRIVGGSRYAYLDGTRQQLSLANVLAYDDVTIEFGYRLELNDRRDLALSPEFFSESPLRQRVHALARLRLAPDWELRAAARYQHSRYGQPDVFVENATLFSATRTDRLYNLGAELRYRLDATWSISGSYEIEHNASNIARYGYLSHRSFAILHWDP